MVKVIYATVTGPSETIISINNLLNFINRFSVISIEPVEVDRWQIEKVDRYWYYCGRNNREFVETTYWYDPITLRRKETSRKKCFFPSEEWEMPDWCRGITEHRRSLDAANY